MVGRNIQSKHRAVLRALAGAVVAALLLGGCAQPLKVRGNLPDPEVIGEIATGIHTRDDVKDKIGSPSAISTFEDDKWYYIGQKIKQFAFLKPKVVERSVLVVSFDESGVVDDTRLYTLEDGRIIDPVDRVTPTEGREITFLQQLLGNLGRFPVKADQGPRP